MAEFYLSLNNRSIATQVAAMINTHNKWATTFSANSIIASASHYFIELHLDKVVGCAGGTKTHPNLTKIQHICVLPQYRRVGIGKKLTDTVIKNCETDYVYMTIREDNMASIAMANSLGFIYTQKHWFRNHWTYTYSRRTIISGKEINNAAKSM